MNDLRVNKLAELLVKYSVSVKKGDKVMIKGEYETAPLVLAVYGEVIKAGGHPIVFLEPEGISEIFFKNASDEQLKFIHEPDRIITNTYDVTIRLGGDSNTRDLSKIDSSRMVMRHRARAELMKTSMHRSAVGELRWTYTMFPTNAYAQDAEMSLAEYEDFVYNACLPDMNDPVGYWQRFSAKQEKIIQWLKGKKRVHIKGIETDITLSIEGRPFINCDGRYNIPDGEVFTSPVENSVNGHVYFSYPAIEDGREVTGVRLWFENGKVVKATAEKNEEFLLKTLDTDIGACYLGEFAIGTSPNINIFTRQILYDEKINGSFHMALGAGYPESGSKNESAIHWDMICDLRSGGEIHVDDELLHKNGKFVIDFQGKT
ncbi:MAG: aminopeptidase [Dehalococcoidales bacterium]|nr:aminopeptidase [Dehalococcoidales bacterium]